MEKHSLKGEAFLIDLRNGTRKELDLVEIYLAKKGGLF